MSVVLRVFYAGLVRKLSVQERLQLNIAGEPRVGCRRQYFFRYSGPAREMGAKKISFQKFTVCAYYLTRTARPDSLAS